MSKPLTLNKKKVLEFLGDFKNFTDILAIVFGINAEDMSLEHIGFMFNDADFFETFFKEDILGAVIATNHNGYDFKDDFVLIEDDGTLVSYTAMEVMNEFIDNKHDIANAIFRLYEQDEFMCELLEDCFE